MTAARWWWGRIVGGLVLAPAVVGCASKRAEAPARTVEDAMPTSAEGVILLPSVKAEEIYELSRLNEIAVRLRTEAARCFVRRAIETMEVGVGGGFVGVPDGQLELRTRIAPDGRVVRTERLEDGFEDASLPECFDEAVRAQRWPSHPGGNVHFVDVVYWTSLGRQPRREDPRFVALVERQQAEVEDRARRCLERNVLPGDHRARGLVLVGADGAAIGSRVDAPEWAEPVRRCVARVVRDLRLPAESDTFVRPVAIEMGFDVDVDGSVWGAQGEWLRLVRLEEHARREEVRRAPRDRGAVESSREVAPEPPAEPDPGSGGAADPGSAGLRLPLGGRP